MLDPGGLALRNLGRIRKNLRHRSPQSWGGSDRTKFYHPPLPSAGGRRPPIIPPAVSGRWWSRPFWNLSCVRRRGGFRTCRGQSARFVETKRPFSLPRLELGVSRLLLPHLAASVRFQKRRKRKDHSLKKFSGLRPARQDPACAFSPTPASKSRPQASKTRVLF